MKVFLDTSALFKLYYREQDSSNIERIFINQKVSTIFLSDLAKLGFSSTVWRKVRMQEISELQAKILISSFESDYGKYSFVKISSVLIELARALLRKYGNEGL